MPTQPRPNLINTPIQTSPTSLSTQKSFKDIHQFLPSQIEHDINLQSPFLGRGSYGEIRSSKIRPKYFKNPTPEELEYEFINVAIKLNYGSACSRHGMMNSVQSNKLSVSEQEIKIYRDISNYSGSEPSLNFSKEKNNLLSAIKLGKFHIVKFYGVIFDMERDCYALVMEKADTNLNTFLHGWEGEWQYFVSGGDMSEGKIYPWFEDVGDHWRGLFFFKKFNLHRKI